MSEVSAQLDEIARAVQVSAPFDLSPRGVRFRPGPELAAMLDRLVALGDAVVPALAERLGHEALAIMAIVWLYLLVGIATKRARAVIETFIADMKRRSRWTEEFPGQREILLFIGEWNGV